MKSKIIKAYEKIEPSKKLIEETKEKIAVQRQHKRNIIILISQCVLSAAACLALTTIVIPSVWVSQNYVTSGLTGSVFSGTSAVICIILFICLCIFFIMRFVKKRK